MKVFVLAGLAAAAALNNAQSEEFYPSPIGGRFSDDASWGKAYKQAREFVAQLTLVEKVNITTGTGFNMGPCVGNTGSVPRLNQSAICLQDGPVGVAHTDRVTVFPCGLATAATWNEKYFYKRGAAMGQEAKKKGVDVLLGPVSGPIGYKALGGRNFEAFGSDPYLSGKAGGATVRGMQSAGVMANAKHWIGNEQEHYRRVEESQLYGMGAVNYSISANIDDRAMHEVFAWPFADMVHAGVGSVMCSYNQINNSQASQNSYTINKILKEELGFQGFIMTDWGAHDDGVKSAFAGLDMSMPGAGLSLIGGSSPPWGPQLTMAVLSGAIPEWRVDDMVTRIMAAYFKFGLDKNHTEPNFHSSTLDTYARRFPSTGEGDIVQVNWHVDVQSANSSDAAYLGAVESFVLLKNVNGTLPLKASGTSRLKSLAVLGIGAGPPRSGVNSALGAASEGALANGWGSASVRYPYLSTPYEALSQRAAMEGISIDYFMSEDFDELDMMGGIALDTVARDSEVNVIFTLADSGESFPVDDNYGDRNNASLWHRGDELILRAASLNKNNVVVVTATGPVNMEKWINHENVTAVLFNPPNGQDFGFAASQIIFGDENPSGRLPFTIAKNDTDYFPVIYNWDGQNHTAVQDNMDRGLLIDYRYYDAQNITPRFEFGYGLSYSTWQLSGLSVATIHAPNRNMVTMEPYLNVSSQMSKPTNPNDCVTPEKFHKFKNVIYPWIESLDDVKNVSQPAPLDQQRTVPSNAGGASGGNSALWEIAYSVTVIVRNTGSRFGKFVPQLYIGFPQSDQYPTPLRQLRGFTKVAVPAHNETQVGFDLTTRDISVWSAEEQTWIVQHGEYTVYVGSSSRNLPLKTTFKVTRPVVDDLESAGSPIIGNSTSYVY